MPSSTTHGVCQWCQSIVKAPEGYNRKRQILFCSPDCKEKEWLFQQWQQALLKERK